MTALSTQVQTPIEQPSKVFCDLRIFAARDGDRVTGRVEFPYETHGHTKCLIDYRSTRPVANPQSATRNPQSSDRAAHRIRLAKQYLRLCKEQPETAKCRHALQVASGASLHKCSPRSIQLWADKLETEGPDTLADHYVKPPRKVPALDAARASDAVLVCAWWSFRIGNVDVIGTKMLAIAAGTLASGYPIADLVAAIDCYYAWPCDRAKYPFKTFVRWLRHDLDKWLLRAATDGDYHRAVAAGKRERIRDTHNRHTRSAIRKLATVAPSDPQSLDPSTPNPQSAIREAKTLSALGADQTARQHIAASAPGMTPLAAKEPETMAEFLAQLDDRYRTMLLQCNRLSCEGRHARRQAAATLPLWWDLLPRRIRGIIDLRLDAWCKDHGIDTDHPALAARKVAMLVPYLRPDRSGIQTIAAALRLPA